VKKIVFALLVVLALAFAVTLMHEPQESPGPGTARLPWQIDAATDGSSTVFGLSLPRSTIADAKDIFGAGMELGIIANADDTGSLEAYYGHFNAGGLTGKLVLGATVDTALLAQFRARAVRVTHTRTGARRFVLHPDDLPRAYQSPIGSITFLPAVDLDPDVVAQRFGPPQERILTAGNIEHFLYSNNGLDVIINPKGEDILQYVAPRQFNRLRDPLQGSAIAP
jgi:hypothetical protein